ncbi:hypothetical protein D3C85_1756160 [compost metagenome]
MPIKEMPCLLMAHAVRHLTSWYQVLLVQDKVMAGNGITSETLTIFWRITTILKYLLL